jgi:hypothetical protein
LTALSEGFSSQFLSGKPTIPTTPNSQGNLESDLIVVKVIEAITPLFTAQGANITASIKAIQISLLSKIAALTKPTKAQDEKIAVLGAEISKNSIQAPNLTDITPRNPPLRYTKPQPTNQNIITGANAIPLAQRKPEQMPGLATAL